MVALNFNATTVAPNAALEPLPSGTYDVIITKTEEKPTTDGQGAYIEFEMTVQNHPTLAGRKVYDRLNIRNKSEKAVEIAYGTLSAICHVTGRHQIQDTGQLHGIPFKAVVAKQPRSDRPDQMTNEVKGYKDIQGNDPGQPGGGGQQAQPQGQGGAPSWAGGPPQGQAAPQPQYQQTVPQQGYAPPQNGPQPGQQPPQWAGGGQQPPAQQPPAQQQAPAPQQGAAPGGPGFVPGQAPPWAGGQAQG